MRFWDSDPYDQDTSHNDLGFIARKKPEAKKCWLPTPEDFEAWSKAQDAIEFDVSDFTYQQRRLA